MKYIVTIVETIRRSEMVEAESEDQAFAQLNNYDFNSIASRETKTKHVEVQPVDAPTIKTESDAETDLVLPTVH